jgi:hypothetical protein
LLYGYFYIGVTLNKNKKVEIKMNQALIKELEKDYMGTYRAWEEAYKNGSVFWCNTLREKLMEIQCMMIAAKN